MENVNPLSVNLAKTADLDKTGMKEEVYAIMMKIQKMGILKCVLNAQDL